MRYLSMFVVITFVFVFAFTFAAVAAAGPLTPRPLDPIAVETFERSVEKSAAVRALVATLEDSNVIVHIVSARSMPATVGGKTQFVTNRGGYRYVRITVNAELPLRSRSVILEEQLRDAWDLGTSRAADNAARRGLQAEPVAKFDH